MRQIGVYIVEDNVEIPDVADTIREYALPPLSVLDVGESVMFPMELRKSVQTTASRIKKANGREFVVRKVDTENVRVWRTK